MFAEHLQRDDDGDDDDHDDDDHEGNSALHAAYACDKFDSPGIAYDEAIQGSVTKPVKEFALTV